MKKNKPRQKYNSSFVWDIQGAGDPVLDRDPTGDCFSSIPSFIFWDSYSGQHFVPEIDPVRVK